MLARVCSCVEVREYGDTHKNRQKKSTFHLSDCFALASAEGSFLLNSFSFRFRL